MKALRIYAGPQARRHIEKNGLRPQDIGVVPGAAGGPKGLMLGALDRFIFGDWLAQTTQPVHLAGASIGAWRMATACLNDPVAAFERLEHDYIHQHYELQPGQKRPSAELVSEQFGQSLKDFYGGRVHEVLNHPRFRLHIITSRGRHLLGREHRIATPLGYLGAFLSNSMHRKAMGAWLERVVFSSRNAPLPFATHDLRTRQVALSEANFNPALQASCSIPFMLKAVHNIPGAPPGAYWDGGITDYHLHLNYASNLIAGHADGTPATDDFDAEKSAAPGLVLYPHFQKAVVPGWLDKGLKWRHGATHFLDNMVLLAPDPDWVKTLPNGKLPDRSDFMRYGADLQGRVKAWSAATAASTQLAEELQGWLARPDMGSLSSL
ncbi:patatin-like phospholipase family protein [Polaromonas jejuensis]|uniref:Patatin-like phospholipase family protein n=1 Tax=Polaromonas jejuensis TaxID=457502 RepID=A0ABW0QHN8_9BURK|nr:patatin-like phospholipase family protein [Polaromonas jejuensis]